MRCLNQALIFHIRTDDDAAGIQVIVQRLWLTQEFRAEDDILAARLFPDALGISHRNGGLDDHNRIRVILHDQLDHSLDCGCVKKVLLAVVICRSRNNNKVRIAVGEFGVQRCGQIQLLFSQILFNILILNRRLFTVDQFHFFRDDIHSIYFMVLRQQCGYRKANIAGTSNCNRVILHHSSPCLS